MEPTMLDEFLSEYGEGLAVVAMFLIAFGLGYLTAWRIHRPKAPKGPRKHRGRHLLTLILMTVAVAACEDNDDAPPAWMPVCEEMGDECTEWETACNDYRYLDMCICGRWEQVHDCWEDTILECWNIDNIDGCVNPNEPETLYQIADFNCDIFWVEEIQISYLCYYFPDSDCAAELCG